MDHSAIQKAFQVDQLTVSIYRDRQAMGQAAAKAVAQQIKATLDVQERVSMVFAAAPSQDDFLASLACEPDVDWQRVIAFHMDEYIGLSPDAPQSFGNYLRERLFNQVRPGVVNYIDANPVDLLAEITRYSTLLQEYPLDITCAGVGENGHLAFNDPPFANFEDEALIKVVQLSRRSRQQQVHDGCFDQIAEVPQHALTMTIPALLSASFITCAVPGQSKAEAIREMLLGPITPDLPASVLRRHPNAILYLDPESAALIPELAD